MAETIKAGSRTIEIELRNAKRIVMNHKKIRRLMRKFHLLTKVIRTNPYLTDAKATQENRTLPNQLNQVFNEDEPQKVFLTDITYLYYGKA